MTKKIKSKKVHEPKIKKPESTTEVDYPVFCFKHLQETHNKDYKFYLDFILRLKRISSLSWDYIHTQDRHGYGTEKMPIGKIKKQLPNFITPDVSHLTVFRANSDNRPFLGIRNNNVFHVVFIEENFGDIYDH